MLMCGGLALGMVLSSCAAKQKLFLDSATPQEQVIAPTKMTDETQTSVVGNREWLTPSSFAASGYGGDRKKGFYWGTGPMIALSPDGTEMAYLSLVDDAHNVMVKKSTPGGSSTQRTFRRANGVCWGPNDMLYFNDNTASSSTIGEVDAHRGSLVKQITSNNNDWAPAVSEDGELIYFTRYDGSGPSIWRLNTTDGALTNCGRGYGACIFPKNKNKIVCTRNSTKGNSEIWLLDFANGDETLLLSDANRGFSDPAISSDGKWILVVGNSLSSITKKQNTDIYAVRTDGTQLTQITYHPEVDCSPVFSPDNQYIYFVSSRANKDRKFNIWRINNPLK